MPVINNPLKYNDRVKYLKLIPLDGRSALNDYIDVTLIELTRKLKTIAPELLKYEQGRIKQLEMLKEHLNYDK